MTKKILLIIPVIALLIAMLLPFNDTEYTSDFDVYATYDGSMVEVQFTDKSRGTHQVSMEIQGMKETFFRTYNSYNFTDGIHFGAPPQYGWGVHPILLHITHDTLGNITLKTEFRDLGQPQADIIFVRP